MKTTRMIAFTGLAVALVAVTTMLVQIPVPQTKGYINLGDKEAKVNGWYYILGDEGSGYEVGLKAL